MNYRPLKKVAVSLGKVHKPMVTPREMISEVMLNKSNGLGVQDHPMLEGECVQRVSHLSFNHRTSNVTNGIDLNLKCSNSY